MGRVPVGDQSPHHEERRPEFHVPDQEGPEGADRECPAVPRPDEGGRQGAGDAVPQGPFPERAGERQPHTHAGAQLSAEVDRAGDVEHRGVEQASEDRLHTNIGS